MSAEPKPASGTRMKLSELQEAMIEDQPKPATGEEVIIVNGKPFKVKDIIDKMEDDYRERHGLPDPEE